MHLISGALHSITLHDVVASAALLWTAFQERRHRRTVEPAVSYILKNGFSKKRSSDA